MLPRRILLLQVGLSAAANVIGAGVTPLPAAATNNGNHLSNDPKRKHRREKRHDRSGRRRSKSARMVPM